QRRFRRVLGRRRLRRSTSTRPTGAVLLPGVLGLRLGIRLPLHVARVILPAAAQGADVVNDVATAPSADLARPRARDRGLEESNLPWIPPNPAVVTSPDPACR